MFSIGWLYFTQCLTSFSCVLYGSPPSLPLCMVFDVVSSNIDEGFSINPPTNMFVFGNFNIQHKDWLTYSGGTDRPVINDLMVIILDCDSHSLATPQS